MFFNKRKTANSAPVKHQSVLGLIFNPEFGKALVPMGEATSMFVRMIALIFSMNGLFPKDHPGLSLKPGAKLSLSEIIHTAWTKLSFTRAGAPKVALFIAVVGTLVCSALAIVTIFLLMFVGRAHAAPTTPPASTCTSTMFCPPSPSTDLAYNWIQFLFLQNGTTAGTFANANYLAQTSTLKTALITALGVYSDAILIFASFILFYHLVSMVVETAHTGVPMGKRANQIWAPIRLVVAIGLLVPVSSSGLNSGQYIVVQMAEWGSGLASYVWNQFVSTSAVTVLTPPPAPDVSQLAENIVKIKACELMFNYETSQLSSYSSDITAWGDLIAPSNNPGTMITSQNPGTTGFVYRATNPQYGVNCGSVTFPGYNPGNNGQVSASLAANIAADQQSAYNAAFALAETELTPFFTKDSTTSPPTGPYFLPDQHDNLPPATEWKDVIGDVALSYQKSLNSSIAGHLNSSLTKVADNMTQTWAQMGWISAGAYFNSMARAQGDIETAVASTLPKVEGPNITPVDPISYAVGKGLLSFDYWLEEGGSNAAAPNNNTAIPTPAPTNDASLCGNTTTAGTALKGLWYIFKSLGAQLRHPLHMHVIDLAAQFADYFAARNCVWQSGTTDSSTGASVALGIRFNTADPFSEMVRLGFANLNTAYQLLDITVLLAVGQGGLSIFGSVAKATGDIIGMAGPEGAVAGGAAKLVGGLSNGIASVLGVFVSLCSFLALIFFIAGFMLAYFLPLIPFLTFLLSSLTWFIMVIESIVMMPLVALAHLNPEGDGLPGAHAKSAYFFIFSMFLRPVLMIFGLVCGWLVFVTAAVLMNNLYLMAASGAVDLSGGAHILVSKMVLSIFYVVILYIVCHKSFLLINYFPDHALQWMNAGKAPTEPMGDASHLGSQAALVSGYVGEKSFGQIAQASTTLSGNVSKSVESGTKGYVDQLKTDKADETARQRHADLTSLLGRRP